MYATQSHQDQRLFFTRQPIVGVGQQVWGHELVARNAPWTMRVKTRLPPSPKNESLMHLDHERQPVKSYANMPGQVGGKKVLVNFSPEAVLQNIPKTLSSQHTIIEINEAQWAGEELLWALENLKNDGYVIAIDEYEGAAASQKLLQYAQIVKVSVLGKTQRQLLDIINSIPSHITTRVAKGIESKKLFDVAQTLGFSHFQGSFFRKPYIVTRRTLTGSQAARMELFNIIETGSPDFGKLADAISMDATISYRLLRFLNSAAFSFPVEITSINHAVVILGWNQVKAWLRMAVLTDLAPADKSTELVRLAALRSNFFRLAAERSKYDAEAPDELFLLGLFSLLEAMLDIPIEEVVQTLPISEKLKAGLRREYKPFSLWLELAQRVEAADWKNVDRIIDYLRLDRAVVANSYYDAHVLTNSFFGNDV